MNQDNSMDNLLAEGHLQLERGQYEKALEIFQHVDTLAPNNPQIKYGFGLTYFRLEQYQHSIEYLNLALQLKSDYLLALVRRGLAYKYLGQTELANVDFEAVLQVEPHTYEDWRARGITFDELKNYESALECYEKALEIEPNDHLSWHNKGYTLDNLQLFESALECYDKALAILPDSFLSIKNCGYILFILQRYQEALDSYNKAVELKPDDYISYTKIGAILANLKQHREAITSFDKALEIRPDWQAAQVKKIYVTEYLESLQQNQEHLCFLLEILLAINNGGKKEHIYILLEKNLSLVNIKLAEALETWVMSLLPNTRIEQQQAIASDIWDFCSFIRYFELSNLSDNIEIVIAGRKIISLMLPKENFPQDWAGNQFNLGLIYLDRIQGDKSDNIEAAINYYQNSLLVKTEEDYPESWAITQSNLAYTYWDRIVGNKTENIEIAIACFIASLRVRTETDFPEQWSYTKNSLGRIYIDRIEGDKKDNIEIAIAHYTDALLVRTEKKLREKWAITQKNLGNAFVERIVGFKRENIETAISYYTATLRVYNKTDFPQDWASSQHNLGFAYLCRIAGERKNNIEASIAHSSNALTIYTEEDYPEEWAMTLSNVGAAFVYRIEGDRKDNLETAINCLNAALRVFTKEEYPEKWAMTYLNLGAAFLYRIEGNRKQNLEAAIGCLGFALDIFNEADSSQNWAMAYLNLGAACLYRIEGDRKDNLETAINCLNAALRVFTKEEYPQERAMIYLNGGAAYLYRISGDRKDNLETAIGCLYIALEVFTKEDFPREWAMVYLNLGAAFLFRVSGKKEKNLESAIDCCNKALEVFTFEDFPREWAMIYLNLGAAFMFRTTSDKEENLETAINCCNKALEVFTKEDFPQEWAMLHLNLGNAFIDRTTDDKEKNVEIAITTLLKALDVFSEEYLPHEWAMIQHSLGLAYSERILEEQENNLKKAIEYYQAALTIETPQSNPFDCLRTTNNLGSLAFTQGNWQLAIFAYSTAIEAIENSRLISSDDARRQEIIGDAISVYANIVQAFINNGQIEQAIEYAERSRCRRLVDLMASNDLYSDANIPPEVAKYLEEYETLQKLIDEEQNRLSNNSSDGNTRGALVGDTTQSITRASFNALNHEIEQLEAKKQQVWQKIRSSDRILSEQIQVNPIPFDDICQLIPDSQSALIYCYTTRTKLQIFVIFKDKTIKLHTTEFDIEELCNFAVDSWYVPYHDDFEAWKKQMPQNLALLADNLNLFELVQNHLQNIEELIIIPHLYLHSIPFSALPINPPFQETAEGNFQQLLGERFRLRILPSVQVLQFCHQRSYEPLSSIDYGTIEDADNSLPYSQYEGEQIAQIFNIPDTNRLKGKTQATVKNYRQLIGRVQVLHSCHHASSRIDNPLESCLILADGTISLGSIMSPGWRLPNLSDVFLSCCETNLGMTKSSDDPLTIATGFLCAGARSVVSTLWKVDDLATAIFSIIYYQLRKDVLNRPTALQQAQHQLKNLTGEELKQRFYPAMHQYLKQEQDLASEKYNQSKGQLQQLTIGTLEYKKTETERIEWAELRINIGKSKALLEEFVKHPLPFAHPYYWAGFISQGLR